MITREQIPSVLDHAVYDTQGNKIGDAKHIFLDDVSGRPEWASVKTGMFGARESFVPIRDANLVEDHLEVPFDKAMVREAPTVAVDAGGHLSAEEEGRLYEYYGVDWDTAWQQSGEPAEGPATPMPAAEEGMMPGAEGGIAEDGTADQGRAMPGGTAGEAGMAREAPRAEAAPAQAAPMPAAPAESGVTPGEERAAAGAEGGFEDAMTRSEEHMHVTTERRPVGRARLRKYVVTEVEEQQIPLAHEEVRVEREPITEENRAAAMAGEEISEGQHEVTLYAERPVIETETVPVERVRLDVEEMTEQETVRGEVRKEQIDVEMPEEEPGGGPGASGSGGGGAGRSGGAGGSGGGRGRPGGGGR